MDDDDDIPFPSKMNMKPGDRNGLNRPAAQQMSRQEVDDISWGTKKKPTNEVSCTAKIDFAFEFVQQTMEGNSKAAMNKLQAQLQGSSMQEMMSSNFQGSFNSEAKNKNLSGPGGTRADPKFAQAHTKA